MTFFLKHAHPLLILLLLLFADANVSIADERGKIDVAVMPIESPGLDHAIYESLTNSLELKLKRNREYNFIKSTADNSSIKLVLLTSIGKTGDSYFLKTKIFDTENGTTVALSDIECKRCTIYSLEREIAPLVNNILEVKQNGLKRDELIEITFKKLEETDKVDNSLFPLEKKIAAWQEFLNEYPENNPQKKEAQGKVELLKSDVAFIETEKAAAKLNSLDKQEKLWTDFIARHEKTGRQATIQDAKDTLEDIIAAKKRKERKERRDRKERRK